MSRSNVKWRFFALLILLLTSARPSAAAPAYVNSPTLPIDSLSGTNVAFPSTFALTGGNLEVVDVRWSTNVTISSITDTASNTYAAAITRQTISGTDYHQLWYAFNVTGNATDTITLNFSSAASGVYATAAQYSGISTTSPLDGTPVTANATGTAVTSPSFSTAQASELIVSTFGAAGGSASTVTPSGTSGTYTTRTTSNSGGVSGIGDYIASSLQSSVTATWTGNASDTTNIIVASFKAPGGAVAVSRMTLLGVGP